MRPGVIRSVCSAQETGRELVLLRISGKLLRLEEPMCSTTNTAAFKSDGKLEMIRSSAATPPCDAPITMILWLLSGTGPFDLRTRHRSRRGDYRLARY